MSESTSPSTPRGTEPVFLCRQYPRAPTLTYLPPHQTSAHRALDVRAYDLSERPPEAAFPSFNTKFILHLRSTRPAQYPALLLPPARYTSLNPRTSALDRHLSGSC